MCGQQLHRSAGRAQRSLSVSETRHDFANRQVKPEISWVSAQRRLEQREGCLKLRLRQLKATGQLIGHPQKRGFWLKQNLALNNVAMNGNVMIDSLGVRECGPVVAGIERCQPSEPSSKERRIFERLTFERGPGNCEVPVPSKGQESDVPQVGLAPIGPDLEQAIVDSFCL